jgi:hypothetical protein
LFGIAVLGTATAVSLLNFAGQLGSGPSRFDPSITDVLLLVFVLGLDVLFVKWLLKLRKGRFYTEPGPKSSESRYRVRRR